MNFLRRELAPISQQGWSEIDSMAKRALTSNLSGRKFVNVDGPHGLSYACVPLGRLSLPEKQNDEGVRYGIHQVLPLVETRINFSLRTWELDNLDRGAKDVDLDAVVKGCRESAAFEDKVVFDGIEPAGVIGIHQALKRKKIPISLNGDAIIDAISEAQAQMLKDGVAGTANLVVSAPLWKFLAHNTVSGSLRSMIENQIGGKVIYSGFVKDAFLVANRGGDLELTVGQDFAIGYHSHTANEINLFIAESFTFRVVAPEALSGFILS